MMITDTDNDPLNFEKSVTRVESELLPRLSRADGSHGTLGNDFSVPRVL